MKYLPLFLLLTTCQAQAETYLTTTIASYHADRETEYNETNPGLGIKHKQWIIGGYQNSHYNPAYYAGYEFRKSVNAYVSMALQTGLLTGYEDSQLSAPSHNGTYIYALPSLIIGKDVQYKLGIVPVDNWTLTFQIDWRI